METLFYDRLKEYFKGDYDLVLDKLKTEPLKSIFLNAKKADRDEILNLFDFDYHKCGINPNAFIHECSNIGKTKAYELGLIYPQEISASLPALIPDVKEVKLVVDMASSPGGKSINILNRLSDDSILIANEIDYKRAQVLTSNLERMGFSNVIVTNKNTKDLTVLNGLVDLVILDAPCSGEGMVKKYPEIIKEYSLQNIQNCAMRQEELLENAYSLLKKGGQLLYSTCTFAHEEDEEQINNFIFRHPDMKLKAFKLNGKEYSGMAKFTFLDDMEGQFMAYMVKESMDDKAGNIRYKTISRNKIVEEFIESNIDIHNYYLYNQNEHYYLSFMSLPDLKDHVLRYGIYLGDLLKNRFEPSHHLFRANCLKDRFKYCYELNDEQYDMFIKGLEIDADIKNGYVSIRYHGHLLGFGKTVNGKIKNKYPKGLRRMI